MRSNIMLLIGFIGIIVILVGGIILLSSLEQPSPNTETSPPGIIKTVTAPSR